MALNFEDYKNTLDYPAGDRKDPQVKAGRDAHNAETARLTDKFRADFYAELGIEKNPKKEKLFSKAWEMGHSAGYSEVMNYGYDLVELIE